MAERTSDLSDLFLFLLPNLPLYLVWLLMIVLALVFWSRHPGVSLLTMLACSILLLQSVVGSILIFYGPRMFEDPDDNIRHLRHAHFMSMLSLVRTGVNLAAWIMLIFAIFGWRSRAMMPSPRRHFPEDRPPPPRDLPPTAIRE